MDLEQALTQPLVQSALKSLRERFGEDGKAEMRLQFAERTFRYRPESFAEVFRRLGWSVSHHTEQQFIHFTFSMPPEGALPITAKDTQLTAELITRFNKFLERGAYPGGTQVRFPVTRVSYRIAREFLSFMRTSAGREVTMSIDGTGRINGFIVELPKDPFRSERPPCLSPEDGSGSS